MAAIFSPFDVVWRLSLAAGPAAGVRPPAAYASRDSEKPATSFSRRVLLHLK
jgi:hypothetical protein